MDNVLQIVEQTAMNVNGLSKQMGILLTRVEDHDKRLLQLEEKTTSTQTDLNNFKDYVKDNEYLEPHKLNAVRKAMGNRIVTLLNPLGLSETQFGEFYGKFMSKFWVDCKKHSYAVGRSGVYTKEKYYEPLMEYIGSWIPEGWGSASGYIDHLEVRKANKANNRS